MAQAATKTAQDFYNELQALEDRFADLKPELEVTVRDPEMDVEGYVVVWNTGVSKGGPLELSGKGGTRVTDTLDIEEVKMLSRTMAIKNAAAGLPLGGAKSGLKADSLAPGFEQKYRRFVKLCQPFLHENGGIFGGFGFDIGARSEMPHWACDELDSTRSFTGKPIEMGGTDYDREGIAGLGVAVAARTLMECEGENAEGATFAVQGLGAMGAAVLRYFSEDGGVPAALSDPKYGGSWRFENGMSEALRDALIAQDVDDAKNLLTKEGVHVSKGAEDVLYENVDVLFPCAVQDVITPDNAAKIKARYMSEGANQCTMKSVYPLLDQQGIKIVPDFIANPGGIIAAFVELTSDVSAEDNAKNHTKVAEAKAMTRSKIAENVREMVDIARENGVNNADAGLYLALSRVFSS